MGMIRINPMWELNNMTREMNKFMKNISAPENKPRIEIGDFKPRIDVLEDDKAIYFEAELAGLNKDNIKISVNDENILSIKGEKKFENNDKLNFIRTERAFGNFLRTFQLPDNIDTENINANFENGVLILTLPKMKPVKPEEKEVKIN